LLIDLERTMEEDKSILGVE